MIADSIMKCHFIAFVWHLRPVYADCIDHASAVWVGLPQMYHYVLYLRWMSETLSLPFISFELMVLLFYDQFCLPVHDSSGSSPGLWLRWEGRTPSNFTFLSFYWEIGSVHRETRINTSTVFSCIKLYPTTRKFGNAAPQAAHHNTENLKMQIMRCIIGSSPVHKTVRVELIIVGSFG